MSALATTCSVGHPCHCPRACGCPLLVVLARAVVAVVAAVVAAVVGEGEGVKVVAADELLEASVELAAESLVNVAVAAGAAVIT